MGSDAPLVDIAEEALVDFEIEVMEIPQYDPENPQMISQGPSICIFNKRTHRRFWLPGCSPSIC